MLPPLSHPPSNLVSPPEQLDQEVRLSHKLRIILLTGLCWMGFALYICVIRPIAVFLDWKSGIRVSYQPDEDLAPVLEARM